MKSVGKIQKLPNEVEAILFVCNCFGIGVKELNQMLELKRRLTQQQKPNPYEKFPKEFYRTMLMRAKANEGKWSDQIKIIAHETLYDRIRRENGKPLWSFTGALTAELISSSLNLYTRLLPKLETEGISRQEILWLLVENVFVPTAFIKLVQEWRSGLGPEFRGEDCWYLPVKSDGKILKPVSRILEYWGRASDLTSGYKTSLRFTKKNKMELETELAKRESLKKRFEHWRSGKHLPSTLDEIHKFVNQVTEVKWLDEPNTWKTRLTLAFAMQKICDAMDEICKESSLKLPEIIKQISEERIVCDDDKFLAGSHTFFAARLLQLRLQAEKKWNPVAQHGNWFLGEIEKMAIADGYVRHRKGHVENYVMLDEYVFELGAIELNRVFVKKRKEANRR